MSAPPPPPPPAPAAEVQGDIDALDAAERKGHAGVIALLRNPPRSNTEELSQAIVDGAVPRVTRGARTALLVLQLFGPRDLAAAAAAMVQKFSPWIF